MHCPICNTSLETLSEKILTCPEHHGFLIAGDQLKNLKTTKLTDNLGTIRDRSQILSCPNCGKSMSKVNYNDTGIIIDSCMNCTYRWLDSGEVTKIKSYKPNLDGENLLHILELDNKITALDQNQNPDDPNPEVPLSSGLIGGAIKGYAAGNEQRTLGFLTGASLYGLITGMIKSKFMRIVGPIFIIVFIILGYFIWHSVQQIKP